VLTSRGVLIVDQTAYRDMCAHALASFPLEACGLIAGAPSAGDGPAEAVWFVPCANDAASSKVYTLNARDHLRAERRAEDEGLEILGVVHSHTHTEPYPSPTDITQAPDPAWHYLIVSLRDDEPVVRSWRIVNGDVEEEPMVVSGASAR
jgi:proteasome lid subunit RPN8/RPN11